MAGRPTALTDDLMLSASAYLSEYKDKGEAVPSIAGLAKHLGICRPTVYDWSSKADPTDLQLRFSYIVKDILQEQEIKLLSGGLTSDFNASIAKLMLTKHGYTDKQEIHQEVKEVKELSDFYSDSDS